MSIPERENWWKFHYDEELVKSRLGPVKDKEASMLTKVFPLDDDTYFKGLLGPMWKDIASSFEMDGITLDKLALRSCVAHRLRVDVKGLVIRIDQLQSAVNMYIQSIFFRRPLSYDMISGWARYLHTMSSYPQFCKNPVTCSCSEALKPEQVKEELDRFLDWANKDDDDTDAVIKAAVAHLRFMLIHPFNQGNGCIACAITNHLLAKSERSDLFYSMSTEILATRDKYDTLLEGIRKGDGDITEWLMWFVDCFDRAVSSVEKTLSTVYARNRFWEELKDLKLNAQQETIIVAILDNIRVKSVNRWGKITNHDIFSVDDDIMDLIEKGVLKRIMEEVPDLKYSYWEDGEIDGWSLILL